MFPPFHLAAFWRDDKGFGAGFFQCLFWRGKFNLLKPILYQDGDFLSIQTLHQGLPFDVHQVVIANGSSLLP
jgi:hypothetical protein